MHGHKGAQILLGDMYAAGDSVDKDVDEANRWYDMADGKISN
jgi:TPR repeat protein